MTRRLAPLLICALMAGCTRSNMDSQPKYHEYEPGGLFRDGKVLQAPVPGTVARGDLERAAETKQKPQVTAELLNRGRVEYDVFARRAMTASAPATASSSSAACRDPQASTTSGSARSPTSICSTSSATALAQCTHTATACALATVGPSSPTSARCN